MPTPPRRADRTSYRTTLDNREDPTHPVVGGGCSYHSDVQNCAEHTTNAPPQQPEASPDTPERQHAAAQPPAKEADTPTYRLLRNLHINPKVCRELADLPADLVEDVIDLAYDSDVRSVPGWVVAVLRQKKADIAAGVPPVTRPQRSRFSLFGDDNDIPNEPAKRHAPPGKPAKPHQDASQKDASKPAEPRQDAQEAPSKLVQRQDDPFMVLQQARATGDLDAAWNVVLEQLRYRVMRSEFDLMTKTSLLLWRENEAVIGCGVDQKQIVEQHLVPVLRDMLRVTHIVCFIRV